MAIFRRDLDGSFTSSRINARILGIYFKYIEYAVSMKLCAVFNLGISWAIFLKNSVINMFHVCTKILKVS